MLPRLGLLLTSGLLLVGPASAATADQAAVSWTLRATKLKPYERHDYEPRVGTTHLAGPPGWLCVGELAEMRYTQPTVGQLAVMCGKGETIVSTSVMCSYLDHPKPGVPPGRAYWLADGPVERLRITQGTSSWEFAVGCTVSSRHSK